MRGFTEDAPPDIGVAERLFEALRHETGDGPGITRMSYGPGEAAAHQLVREVALELGLSISTDAASNLYVTLEGQSRGPAIMIGSHLDSVPVGGNYDGAAGVAMGLSVLAGYRRSGVLPERDVTVMAIRAEESTWFPASYIGSRAAFGRLTESELADLRRSGDGLTLGAAIAAAGGEPQDLRSGRAHLDPAAIGVFIEPHIEQGPVLVQVGVPVGIATGIRGSFRYRDACCQGRYAHSGATPRNARHDAVRASAALVGALEGLWDRFEADGHDLTITVGKFSTDPLEHAFSKVSGRVDLAIDARSQSPETLESLREEVAECVAEIGRTHGVVFELGGETGSRPAQMDPDVRRRLESACEIEGTSWLSLASGAGHDAAVFAWMGVPTAMLLIRNENGSHNPLERMELDDFAVAARVLARFCRVAPGL